MIEEQKTLAAADVTVEKLAPQANPNYVTVDPDPTDPPILHGGDDFGADGDQY